MINHRIDIACDITDGGGPSGVFRIALEERKATSC